MCSSCMLTTEFCRSIEAFADRMAGNSSIPDAQALIFTRANQIATKSALTIRRIPVYRRVLMDQCEIEGHGSARTGNSD